ncbi:MAG: hypothetical protein ACKV22_14875 [Bryobacteraceae bacterium]
MSQSDNHPASGATASRGSTAQYYELTLHTRFRDGKWSVVVVGPNGLLISHDTKFASESEALVAAVHLAQTNLHEEKRDGRPPLREMDWQPS